MPDAETDHKIANNANNPGGHVEQRRLSRLKAHILDQSR
jgi:hypothetical protein